MVRLPPRRAAPDCAILRRPGEACHRAWRAFGARPTPATDVSPSGHHSWVALTSVPGSCQDEGVDPQTPRPGVAPRTLRRLAAAVLRWPRGPGRRDALPRERHPGPGHPAGSASSRSPSTTCSWVVAARSTTRTVPCWPHCGPSSTGEAWPSRSLGQPQLAPVRQPTPCGDPPGRGPPGARGHHQRLQQLLRAAGSTARTSPTPSRPRRRRPFAGGRQGPPLLQPADFTGPVLDEAVAACAACGGVGQPWRRRPTGLRDALAARRRWRRPRGRPGGCLPGPAPGRGSDGGRRHRRGARRPAPDWDLVFCSRSGPPAQPWLEPDVNDHLKALAGQGVGAVLLAPVGFVSDHMEVVHDLDTEALATAQSWGSTWCGCPPSAPTPASWPVWST